MKRLLIILGAALAALLAILVIRAATATSMQVTAPPAPALAIDRDAALARFSRAIQFQTISHEPGTDVHSTPPLDDGPQAIAPSQHYLFTRWLAEAYPLVHASLRRETAGGNSLLYTWPGSDPKLPPVLLMGHYDVVPVDPATSEQWTHPPFAGAVADGYVWGRGAIDDKLTVIGILEAAETLLRDGWRPKRTLYFAFGHDEELGGEQGAAQVAKLLVSRGVKLDAIVDEGGVISVGAMEGLTRPVAVIGIAEKGSASVELSATGTGGHSSMPPARTEVGAIAAAVDRVQSRPFDAGVRGATAEMFRWLAPEMPFPRRVVLSNLWLFRRLLPDTNALNAMQRTTTAPTIIGGGVKDNVIPSQARAVINFRILPGDSVESVLAHVRDAVGEQHIQLRLLGKGWDPSPVSDPGAPQFRALQHTIAQVYPDVFVAPYLLTGATDTRHYGELTSNIYRFEPVFMTQTDLARFHGLNERVSVRDFLEGIRFYRALMMNMGV